MGKNFLAFLSLPASMSEQYVTLVYNYAMMIRFWTETQEAKLLKCDTRMCVCAEFVNSVARLQATH